jgi:hypothetical protein
LAGVGGEVEPLAGVAAEDGGVGGAGAVYVDEETRVADLTEPGTLIELAVCDDLEALAKGEYLELIASILIVDGGYNGAVVEGDVGGVGGGCVGCVWCGGGWVAAFEDIILSARYALIIVEDVGIEALEAGGAVQGAVVAVGN